MNLTTYILRRLWFPAPKMINTTAQRTEDTIGKTSKAPLSLSESEKKKLKAKKKSTEAGREKI